MHRGMSGAQVVDVLRRKRPGALFNQAFAEYLTRLNLEGA
jgi:hypothetical protein